eukprot:COSAG03_NODE_10091_length_673_cov_0.695122_1_plen_131_part_00
MCPAHGRREASSNTATLVLVCPNNNKCQLANAERAPASRSFFLKVGVRIGPDYMYRDEMAMSPGTARRYRYTACDRACVACGAWLSLERTPLSLHCLVLLGSRSCRTRPPRADPGCHAARREARGCAGCL